MTMCLTPLASMMIDQPGTWGLEICPVRCHCLEFHAEVEIIWESKALPLLVSLQNLFYRLQTSEAGSIRFQLSLLIFGCLLVDFSLQCGGFWSKKLEFSQDAVLNSAVGPLVGWLVGCRGPGLMP